MPIDQDAIYNRRHLNLDQKRERDSSWNSFNVLQLSTLGGKFQKRTDSKDSILL